MNGRYLHYNEETDTYYSEEGSITGTELAAAKRYDPYLSLGMESFEGRRAIRKAIYFKNRSKHAKSN